MHARWLLGLSWALGAGPPTATAFTLLSWNVGGNGATDWSTNAPQVRAIGRILTWRQPDVIVLQEIPFAHTGQLTNWVRAWLPSHHLATNSGTDGYLRSAVLSRFLVRRSARWLDGAPLRNFGYDGPFTRDLFEVELAVPGFAQPVHVFTTHLKQGSTEADLRRRGAEAAAISNWLVTAFLPTHADRAYLLTGDLNEDVLAPPAGSQRPIAKLVNPSTGLRLLTPRAPGSTSEKTWSTRGPGLWSRLDYLLPGGVLFSNLLRAEVVRTATLQPLPPGLNRDDEVTASDHLPLWAEFAHPDAPPFRVVRLEATGAALALVWEAAPGFEYIVEVTGDWRAWTPWGPAKSGAGPELRWEGPAPAGPAFFRVRRWP